MNEMEVFDRPWFWGCRVFKTDTNAKINFDTLNEQATKKNFSLGVYRHGRAEGLKKYVTFVSTSPDGVRWAESLLGGTDYDLDLMLVESLILRRVRVVLQLEQEGKKTGHYRIPHEGEGTQIGPLGEEVR